MARVMAFDYGTKRIGIAVTDPLQLIANGLDTVHPKDILDFLEKYLNQNEVSVFVVGEPFQLNGSPSDSTPHIKGFIKKLQQKFPSIPIERIDERFTSKMASHAILQSGIKKSGRKDKALVDRVSATIILQSWLETSK